MYLGLLQLLLWDFNSTSNFAVALRRLRSKISSNQREGETSANVNQHRNTRAMGNDVITNAISANQHFASTFSMSIFKFQRRSCKLFFLFAPRRHSAIAPQRACSQASLKATHTHKTNRNPPIANHKQHVLNDLPDS